MFCDMGRRALRALYVDCEPTGLSVERDQAIEVAMLPFTYTLDDGRIAEVLHHETQVYIQDPGRPLDAVITELTVNRQAILTPPGEVGRTYPRFVHGPCPHGSLLFLDRESILELIDRHWKRS